MHTTSPQPEEDHFKCDYVWALFKSDNSAFHLFNSLSGRTQLELSHLTAEPGWPQATLRK